MCMLHQMKLKLSPFQKIKNGSKTIELRLYDEKRQKVQVGDFIAVISLSDCLCLLNALLFSLCKNKQKNSFSVTFYAV